jgi:hypothetical protein
MKTLLAFIPFIIIIACTPPQSKQAIKHIDSLLVENKNLTKILKSTEIDSIKIIYDTVVKYNSFFGQPNLPEMSDEQLEIMYQYGTIEKTFKKFLNNHKGNMLNILEHREYQLNTLKHDIEHKLIQPEEFNEYLKIEDSLMNAISVEVNNRITFTRKHKEMFAEYHEKVLVLIEKLKGQIAQDNH